MNQIPKFFDIHGHLNFATYDADREGTIKRTLESGTWAVSVGTQKDTSQKAVELAEKHEGLFAAIGLHPIHTSKSYHDEKELGVGGAEFTSRGEVFDYDFYKKLGHNKQVVAIGECGLDYFRVTDGELNVMGDAFRKQIELAVELDKPLMLHLRNGSDRSAYNDAFSILNSYFKIHNSRLRGDLHFFAGSIGEAKPFLDMGFSFSFTGVVTFTKSYDEIIRYLPLERIMSETDCPYVAPTPYRGKRNEPAYVSEVVKRIAEIRGEDFEKVRAQMVKNALDFFKIESL